MPRRPKFPGKALLAWLTVNAHVIVVGALFGVFKTTASKLGMAGFDASGIFIITALFLGRLYEWNRLKSLLKKRERAVRAGEDQTSTGPAARRPLRPREQAA